MSTPLPRPRALPHPLRGAGASHPGRVRPTNEDRFHVDEERGVLLVVDGVGGQSGGEMAADVAVSRVRARLERRTGRPEERVREAITLANNEIAQMARARSELSGMACVLTVAVVEDGVATVGHVGDTRLYKLRRGQMRKVTRDHSPVGVREEAGELTEAEAMTHPRRNEVYRTVGAEEREPDAEGFIEVVQVPFEADAALLLCSDGLTDLVTSAEIERVVAEHPGDELAVVDGLIDAANRAGGKDNVTAVFAAGPEFAPPRRASVASQDAAPLPRGDLPRMVLLALAGAVLGAALAVWADRRFLRDTAPVPVPNAPAASVLRVGAGQRFARIADALAAARPGDSVVVAAGTYRESLRLAQGIQLVSERPREAILSPPAGAPEGAAVLTVSGAAQGSVSGFRIAAAPGERFAVGLRLEGASVQVFDLEVAGATRAGIEIAGTGTPTVLASAVHDNLGAGIVVHAPASPRILHNLVLQNGKGAGAGAPGIELRGGARADLLGNVVADNGAEGIRGVPAPDRPAVLERNLFQARGRRNRLGEVR
jgi:serine/threonine protein phosphatase PrpC